ncbi:MAG: preprotein translocase subunit YajC, partial [candidate division WOR-3 bacterium]
MFGIALAQGSSQPAAGTQPGSGLGVFGSLIPLILIIVVFYFLLILPQQRRQKKHQQMLASLKSGDRVVFGSGILGTITRVKDKTYMVKVAENTELEIEKG